MSDSSFSLIVTPSANWSGEARLIKQISNSAGAETGFCRDTTFLVVNDHWRITFNWDDGLASDVTIIDYHK